MTKQTWTAVVSAILFVLSAAVIAMVPVPYVVWAPGATQNLLGANGQRPLVTVDGVRTYPTTGELRLTTVAVTRADADLSLPEALYAHWSGDRGVLPRDYVYPVGATVGDVREAESEMMSTSQDESVAAAIQAAGLPIKRAPQIASVAQAGPSVDKLEPGDLVLSVDGRPVTTPAQVTEAVARHRVGDHVLFSIERDKAVSQVSITTVSARNAPSAPIIGVTLSDGYRYSAKVDFAIDELIGGPSGGLMFALAIYDKITTGGLVGSLDVAGSGAINGSGTVSAVGAIEAKVAAAERDGANVFLLPQANCSDLADRPHAIRIVPVSSLGQAIDSLKALQDPKRQASVKGCS
ncbi:YlbL family protein [Nigerium massiliense]|uniref:YlbL family protein n=1 Tax=Nigerium massiliense TaxID=1522317 RepID=UPI00069403FF|nr:PDZ domain-containing protein [Nigerium massiliense]